MSAPNIHQIQACNDRTKLLNWQRDLAGTLYEREFQAVQNRLDELNREEERRYRQGNNSTLERIESSLAGIHDHARRPPPPEWKLWTFWIAVAGFIVALLALFRDYLGLQWVAPSPAPASIDSMQKPLLAPEPTQPAPNTTPPNSAPDGKGVEAPPVEPKAGDGASA